MPSPFIAKHLTVGGIDPFLPVLLEAINKADDISLAIAFIRSTGLSLIYNALEDAIARGARIRLLTGDYLEVTEPKALKLLMILKERSADVRVYESKNTKSFHMKVFLFTRSDELETRTGCAFVGSSNISQAALIDGLEWNLKVEQQEDQARFELIQDEFERLFSLPECAELSHEWITNYTRRVVSRGSGYRHSQPGEEEIEKPPEPNPVQVDALAALSEARSKGYRRGLVVLATGLGKTWLAAFDSQQMRANRLLFIAHREEILAQAEATFVRVRPDATVGRYTGKEKQPNVDILFASVQTLGTSDHFSVFKSDHFDYVVVDEFHHAAARTYQCVLAHFEPKFLLGLTATPERTDQSDILALCDENLVVDKDLFYGIESQLLCPFEYFGIADQVNYLEIGWRNGRFDHNQLENQLATQSRARHNFRHWQEKHQSRTLAFCISQKHADFMAEYFQRQGVRAASVHSESEMQRNEALHLLNTGDLEAIFSVDLFNEGVDLPAIDTVLMLRPTESKIVFLQQLGRGLRKSYSSGKERLTVLDFIGNHISFFRKPEALFGIAATNQSRRAFLDDLESGSLTLPKGCFVNFDLKSIEFLKQLISTKGDLQVELYRNLRGAMGRRPALAEFYRAGGSVETIRREYGGWYLLVSSENDLSREERQCLKSYSDFFIEIEKTSLTKSFKLVLLEALLELDGFTQPPTLTELSRKSFSLFRRRPLLRVDLPDEFAGIDELDGVHFDIWEKYWRRNPVSAWTGVNMQKTGLFRIEGDKFMLDTDVSPGDLDTFAILTQELINYRFLQYESRLEQRYSFEPAATVSGGDSLIPFFSDFKVACGHFRHSPHEIDSITLLPTPPVTGHTDDSTLFVAQAAGDSMNGGRAPIKDGDYLLFSLIQQDRSEQIPGIADPDPNEYGDFHQAFLVENKAKKQDEFLLRDAEWIDDGETLLTARNPNYPAMKLQGEVSLVAKLIARVDALDLKVHQEFMREEIPGLFGLDFNPGNWNAGHIRPKDRSDQILLVTLNKQGKVADQQYHDYFLDPQTFHWQTQRSTTPSGKKGRAVIDHQAHGSDVHLFVRKNKLRDGKGAPFIYCGRLQYLSHASEKPMNVTWSLLTPLSGLLFNHLR